MVTRAFNITFKDEAVQAVSLKAGTWTFHAYVDAATYSIGLKDTGGVWHNYDLSDQVVSGDWYDVVETITTTFDAVEISLLNNEGTAKVLLPMLEKGSVRSVKRPNDLDIEEAAIVKSASWEIHTSSPVIYKDAPDITTDGVHTPVTVTGRHWVGGEMTEGGFFTVTPNGGTEEILATASPMTIAPANSDDKSYYTIRLYDDAVKTNLLDFETIPVVFKGAKGVDAITLRIDNPVDSIPADADGNILTFSGTGTSIHVYEGAIELDYDGVGTANGKFKVTATPTNITMGTMTDGGNFCTVADATAMPVSEVKATIIYTVTGKTLDGFDFSVIGEQNFSKTKMGKDAVVPIIVDGYWAFWDDATQTYVTSSFAAVGDDGHSPYVDEITGTWWEWDNATSQYIDTGITPQGASGAGVQSIYELGNYYPPTPVGDNPTGWYWYPPDPNTTYKYVYISTRTKPEGGTWSEWSSPSLFSRYVEDGQDGVGVDHVETQYYLSTSSTSLTGGTWQTTVPTWQPGTYIWERLVSVMDDGYRSNGTPYLSQTWETMNQVKSDLVEQQAKTQFQTTTDGGLIYTALIKLFNPGSSTENETSGISGNNKDSSGNLSLTNPAFWAGGTYAEALNGTAKALDRHDGSGYRAGGNISWNVNGDLVLKGQIISPFHTELLTSGTSTLYIDVTKYSNFFLPMTAAGSGNWYITTLPYQQQYNGLTLNFIWRPSASGMAGALWRIDAYSTSKIQTEDGDVYSLDFTSDTDRYVQLVSYWDTANNNLRWVLTKNQKIGVAKEDRVHVGEVFLSGRVSSLGTMFDAYSKFGFTCTSSKIATGQYTVSISKSPYNPLSSSNYIPIITPENLNYPIFSSIVLKDTYTFSVNTSKKEGPYDSTFHFVLIATRELDLRDQYYL